MNLYEHPTIQRFKSIPKQTHLVEEGKNGDCWSCCIAAMLGLPAEQVPHFLEQAMQKEAPSMDSLTQRWLNGRGYWLVTVERGQFYTRRAWGDDVPPLLQISAGPTVRSKTSQDLHAVITVGEALVYDPHPSEAGLLAITWQYLIVKHL